MPTYTLTLPAGLFNANGKAAAATAITHTHNTVTGAATFFAQVIIHEVVEGHYFVGGKPLSGRQVFLNGQIRAGRSAPDRKRLLTGLRDAVASGLGIPAGDVWVYLTDLPARDMIEYGHILPEPGDEAAWMAGLPAADHTRMENTGR
jgi:phenylpyruvate tautomerase PptA (4-oxalocrotonate tautomerase family)